MGYTFSQFVVRPSTTGMEMFVGPRAMPMGVNIGQSAFDLGQAPDNLGQAPENGQEKVLLVLLLFAAYMNLMINLMRAPNRGKD